MVFILFYHFDFLEKNACQENYFLHYPLSTFFSSLSPCPGLSPCFFLKVFSDNDVIKPCHIMWRAQYKIRKVFFLLKMIKNLKMTITEPMKWDSPQCVVNIIGE